jgi:release factor glutamine methyltransferase
MRAETQSGTTSVEALLRAGVRLLTGASSSPRLDAEVLLAHTLGRSRAALFAGRTDIVPAVAAERYLTSVHERQSHRPVAQITGRREFWSLEIEVTTDVLTPRPDTETLVERALSRLPADRCARVVDLGTGSGAIALALAVERPRCEITATDLSAAALEVARRNARRLDLATIRFVAGSWFEATGDATFDMILSNPPYIADSEWNTADAELLFEPRSALAGGEDGLDDLRRIIADAPRHLAANGWLLVEHGASQGKSVAGLMQAAGLRSVTTSPDLAGLPRVTEGQWPA